MHINANSIMTVIHLILLLLLLMINLYSALFRRNRLKGAVLQAHALISALWKLRYMGFETVTSYVSLFMIPTLNQLS